MKWHALRLFHLLSCRQHRLLISSKFNLISWFNWWQGNINNLSSWDLCAKKNLSKSLIIRYQRPLFCWVKHVLKLQPCNIHDQVIFRDGPSFLCESAVFALSKFPKWPNYTVVDCLDRFNYSYIRVIFWSYR